MKILVYLSKILDVYKFKLFNLFEVFRLRIFRLFEVFDFGVFFERILSQFIILNKMPDVKKPVKLQITKKETVVEILNYFSIRIYFLYKFYF